MKIIKWLIEAFCQDASIDTLNFEICPKLAVLLRVPKMWLRDRKTWLTDTYSTKQKLRTPCRPLCSQLPASQVGGLVQYTTRWRHCYRNKPRFIGVSIRANNVLIIQWSVSTNIGSSKFPTIGQRIVWSQSSKWPVYIPDQYTVILTSQ